MNTTVIVKITRPTLVGGERQEIGTTLRVAPLDAADLIGSNKAELAHAADQAVVVEAVRTNIKKQIQQAGRPWMQPEPTGGWQRVH